MISYHDLRELVREMRSAQRAYFNTRGDQELLRRAKALEAAVDKALSNKEGLFEVSQPPQEESDEA